MLLVATLTVERTKLDAFRTYEHKAYAIIRSHGGALERAVVLDDAGATVREMHIVRFPDTRAFERYRADPASIALRTEREACIVATEICAASDGPTY